MRPGPLIALLLLAAWSTAALAASDKPSRPAARFVLRGAQSPEPAKPRPTAAIQSPLPQAAGSAAPRYSFDAAPRVAGYGADPAGGGQCRQSCAKDRYFCASAGDPQDCSARWSVCTAACPGGADSPL